MHAEALRSAAHCVCQTLRIQCWEMQRLLGRTSADIVCGVLDLLSQSKRSAALKAHCCHAHAQHESAALRRWHPLSERMRDGPPAQGLPDTACPTLPARGLRVIKRYPSYRHTQRYRYRSGWDSASVSHLVCVQARVKGLYLYLYLSSVTVIACKCDRERIE